MADLISFREDPMTIRRTIPLLTLLLAGACAANDDGRNEVTSINAALDDQGGDDQGDDQGRADIHHVLLISVDGLHQVDLSRWIAAHPGSTLAKLAGTGVQYTDAHAPTPSDSFPGLLA